MACRSKTIALSTKFLSPAEADKHYNSQEETSFTPRVSSDGTSLQSSEIFEECKWLISLPSREPKKKMSYQLLYLVAKYVCSLWKQVVKYF